MPTRKHVILVAVGDILSKKSDLLLKYTTDKTLKENFKPSIFVNNIQNVIVDRIPYSIHFVNAESDDVYKNLRLNDYKKAHCFLLCYSISSRTSFENLSKWCIEMRKYNPYVPIILVGTESECRKTIEDFVSKEEGQDFMNLINAAGFVECSIRDSSKVDDVFIAAIRSICCKRK